MVYVVNKDLLYCSTKLLFVLSGVQATKGSQNTNTNVIVFWQNLS